MHLIYALAISALLLAPGTSQASAIVWNHLSSDTGDLPPPGLGDQQTGCHVLDIDGNGLNDFVIAERTQSPSIVWYRRTSTGWDLYVIEDQVMDMDAGGHFTDIDGDGDLDLSFGGGFNSNEVWWWANPSPDFHPDSTWTRRVIKNSGSNKHHDQLFGDFDRDGRDELVFWNQLAGGKLMLAEIPTDPLQSEPWSFAPIFTGADNSEGLQAADIDLDGHHDIVGAGYWLEFDGAGGFIPHPIAPHMTFSRTAVGQLVPGGRPEVVFAPGDSDGPMFWYEWIDETWVETVGLDPVLHGHSLQIADIDADGFQDIFVGEMHTPGAGDAARIRILFGDGTGNFLPETVATGFGTHESRVADLDGDGDLDILGKPFSEGTPVVNIWLQDGLPDAQWNFRGIILDPSPHPVPTGEIRDLQVADIDGDSWPDLWLPGSEGLDDLYQMHWYKGPHWTRFPMNQGNFGPGTWIDLDGDGDLDLAVGLASGTPTVVWLENTGNPTGPDWPRHVIHAGLPGEPGEILATDLNRDGRVDLVVLCSDLEACSLLAPTDPRNPWTLGVLGQTIAPRSGFALDDIDRDGDTDLLWGNGWLENPGDPLLTPWPDHIVVSDWPGLNRVLLEDLDHDGRPDAILASSAGNEGVSWFAAPLDPKTGFWTRTSVGDKDFSGIASLQVGDFDADGDQDIFAAEDHAGEDPDKIVIFENSGGTASVWLETPGPATGSHRAKVADLDGDGDLDIAGKNLNPAGGGLKLEMWENSLDPKLELDKWQRHVIDSARPWRAVFVTTGDIDRDGFEDVINGAWWYRNPGEATGNWARFELGLPLKNMAAVSDFDRDGDLDVLGTQGIPWDSSSQFVWTRNDGAGNFTVIENIPDGSGSFLQGTATANFTVDRGLGFNPDEVALSWENGGGGIQMLTVPADPSGTPWAWRNISPTTQFEGIHSGDIDRDGDLDLLLGNIWLRNDSPDWTTFIIENTSEEPDRVLLVDLNRDGRLDALVGFEEWPDELAWYEQPIDPTGPWPRHDIATLFGPMSIDVADLDKDGDLDIVVGEHNLVDQPSSAAYVYENIADALVWQQHLIYFGDEHHMGTQLLDADNDGDMDIVSFGWNTSEVILYENLATPGGTGLPLAPAVTLTPPGGEFFCPLEVELTTETPGASFRFTLDGSAPSESSPLYSVPLLVDTNLTLRARSYSLGFQPGPVAEGIYEFGVDLTDPQLQKVEPAGVPDHLIVTFTEPMDPVLTTLSANYFITPGVTVLEAEPLPDLNSVLLVTSGLIDNTSYSLDATGLFDVVCPPNPILLNRPISFLNTSWLRNNEGLVVLYDFNEEEGTVVHDRSGIDPPLDLIIADPAAVSWSRGRLDVVAETIIQSPGPAGKINDSCRATGEITIEAWITPSDLSLDGPARIVTVSGDQFSRNFTLGQGVYDHGGDRIDVRLTLSTTSTNGQPSIATDPGTLFQTLTHVVYTRDALGSARIYIDGQLITEGLREGIMSNWITTFPLGLANEIGTPGDRFWLGGYHLVAIFDRALTAENVFRNFSAGILAPDVSAVELPMATEFRLHANVPNPFNPVTRITFDIPTAGAVDLAVFDVRGRLVRQLLTSEPQSAGRHSLVWDGRDRHGRIVGAGVYFYRIVAAPNSETRKMLLLK